VGYAFNNILAQYLLSSSMKKYNFLLGIALALASCGNNTQLAFTGKAPGLDNAVFAVKDVQGNNIVGENIVNGAFAAKTILENTGYGTMSFNKNGDKNKNEFEVYLEPGDYSIEVDGAHPANYPKITSPSVIQKELSAYYILRDELGGSAVANFSALDAKANTVDAKKITAQEYRALLDKLSDARLKLEEIKFDALKKYVETNPQSTIPAHIMAGLEFKNDPAAYKAIYDKFSAAAKATDEGKELGEKLGLLMKVQPGSTAPEIAGTTPDGKTFDAKKLDKKLYLVDFWKAGNDLSRSNHNEIRDQFLNSLGKQGVGFISISMDDKRDWWIKAIADDKVTWPQYSDLKGNKSANGQNWMIPKIPCYFLVDGQWKIVERDVDFARVETSIRSYLAKH
jgi:hypothetical protein